MVTKLWEMQHKFSYNFDSSKDRAKKVAQSRAVTLNNASDYYRTVLDGLTG